MTDSSIPSLDKYIIAGIAIALFISILYFTKWRRQPKETNEKVNNKPLVPYVHPDAKIGISPTLGERGVIASRNYKEGDVIEICPAIKQKDKYVRGKMEDYVFRYNHKYSLVGFGFCSMYNHSDSENASWDIVNSKQISITAKKAIQKGEEITISYGTNYWKSRNGEKK